MARPKPQSHRGQLRLIGGRLGGRRLPILDYPGLRPSGDRCRETLFNWLAPVITGSRCLDAFAGSGALGFEALSRGAAHLVMLEQAAPVVRQLEANAATLAVDARSRIVRTDALTWLNTTTAAPFDIVFLDPPFAEGLLPGAVAALHRHGWLTDTARVYVEADIRQELPRLPAGWEWLREKTAGQVRFGLARAGSATPTGAE